MTGIVASPFRDDGQGRKEWDAMVEGSWNGTFLHTRRFLSYHGTRFTDRSIVVRDSGRIVGALPAAQDPQAPQRIVSHPGATYGGLVHAGDLGGEDLRAALAQALRTWLEGGAETVLYKTVPSFYHRVQAEEDTYWLWRSGARLVRVDLTAMAPLDTALDPSTDRRRAHRRALASGLTIRGGPSELDAFWAILEDNLAARHQTRPVHHVDEMRDLMTRFPQAIRLDAAFAGHRMIAGSLLFRAGAAEHCQYSAATPEGRKSGALDLLFQHAMARARAEGARWFDFGISNEEQGRRLNEPLYRFKRSFAGASAVHTFFEIDLVAAVRALEQAREVGHGD
jgi:CelD/BcsL family acetyltransferase involved in cellulose biosynthesis